MATIDDIQNSEKLLDLSNQLINSINERKKLLKGINAEEQLFFATVKQQQKLSQDITANAEKYLGYQIKSKDLAKQIKAVEDNRKKNSDAFTKALPGQLSLEQKLKKEKQDSLKKAFELDTKILAKKKEINDLDEKNQDLQILKAKAERNNKINIAKDLQAQIRENQRIANSKEKEIKTFQTELQKRKDIFKATAETIKNAKEALKSQEKEIAFLKENERIRKRIEKSTGLLGGMAKAVSKIPGIGQYLNADEAITEMEKLAAEIEESGGKSTSFGNRMQIAGKGLSVLAKGAYDNLKSPEAVFTFFLKAALTANDQAVKLGKSLGYGADRADAFREKLVGIERSSNNLNVNTKNLTEAFGELVTATGLAYEFTADQLETQIKLTKQVGLTADQAAQIQRFGVLNNKTSEETYKSFLKGITATRNQLKVGIDFKATLAEAVMVSGQLAANLGNNPEIIGRAIVTAKAFGMTLEQVAKSGESLLNFETSIESELKAELLTGKQLNLERARAAALAGDQISLAEELAKNVGTAAEFTKMNVLQQKALAESVGMTADELANTLRKREEALASGKSLAQVTAEEAAEAVERQSVQDKFNAAMEKLQSIVGNLLAGPLGSFLDLLSGALNIINYMATPLKIVAGIFAGIFGISKAIAITEGLSATIAGRKVGFAAAELGYKTTSNILSIKNNALAAISLATEGGKLSFKQLGLALEGESFTVKLLSYSLALKEIITKRASNMLQAAGNLLGKKGLLSSIGSAVMNAVSSIFKSPAGFLGPFAIPIALAAGGIVGALGYKFLSGDDVMSEGGYGKRTLLSPEGAIRLNDKDTVLAGTDLGGGQNNISGPSIDLTPMIAAINEVKAAVNGLMNRPVLIYLDSKQIGTSLIQNASYKSV